MTSYEDDAVKFLATRENIRQVLEIERLVPKLKGQVKLKFWKELEQIIGRRINEEKVGGWRVELGGNNGPLWIKPTESFPFYGTNLEGFSDRYFIAITFSKGEEPEVKEVENLRKKLIEHNWRREKGRLGWNYLEHPYVGDEFFVAMVDTPDETVRYAADRLWELYKEHREQLEQINTKIMVSKT